eukprot:gnl/TRDRNA2_/TRDRNA2_87768_c0_seq1.p1 gnl/TRDRNA2_/TRDRNA2_87768_c0~~gnl/TRDRNA2_/TRDRNA2_87768_c0_seq1.p1  ORF type:complete len:484 (-),score=74.43 gnl/TRDRNA2_/TRDRNA2_87768_c0_seq1:19-1470(-)
MGISSPPLWDRAQAFVLLFLIPYLNEIKDSWEFAAVPLHFLAQGWPLTLFGVTIAGATLCRLPINALITWQGDWLMALFLVLATCCATYMLMSPLELPAVMLGVAAGHCMDTSQVEHSLCYRWCGGADDDRCNRRLRWQAFSATAGYSTGALVAGAIYEFGGFKACAVLQFSLCSSLALLMFGLPVVHAAFRARWKCAVKEDVGVEAAATVVVTVQVGKKVAEESPDGSGQEVSVGSGSGTQECSDPEKTLRNTTGRFFLPVSLVLICDGLNIFSYVTEWALFAVYFKQVFDWSSTLTGAAQMTGDVLAAGILALSTTKCWAWITRKKGANLRRLDRILLQPPWNLGIFFLLYTVFFLMFVQSTFAVSVAGQICMGTVFVLMRQATQECYLGLSHGCLPLYRKLVFLGSCAFNILMATGSFVSVVTYERLGRTAPFYVTAALCGGWAFCVTAYFLVRYRGRLGLSFGDAEAALLAERNNSSAK